MRVEQVEQVGNAFSRVSGQSCAGFARTGVTATDQFVNPEGRRAFVSGRPAVEVTALDGAHRGYVVLLNHSANPQDVTVTTALPLHQAARILPNGRQTVALKESAWETHLDPFEGAVFEWQ